MADAKVIKLVSESGRVPPCDPQAELVVLASVLERPEAFDALADRLRAKHFHSDANARIWAAMEALRGKGDTPTVQAVANWLDDHGELERVGGRAHLELDIVPNAPYELEPVREAERIVDRWNKRQVLDLCREYAARIHTEPESSADDVRAGLEDRLARLTLCGRVPGMRQLKEVAAEHGKALLVPPGQLSGMTTGLQRIDRRTGGLHGGELAIVAGRPGMGKTAFALHLAHRVSEQGARALLLSFEMPAEQLVARLACADSHVPLLRVRERSFRGDELPRYFRSLDTIAALPLVVCDDYEADLRTIRGVCRRQATDAKRAGTRLGLVVIDYLQLVRTSPERGKTRERELAELTRAYKLLALELDTCVLLVSQLNRAAETRGKDKRPQLSDLRESGAIEQDADLVLLLYRPEYYAPKEPGVRGVCEVNVAKQRNGPTGTARVSFTKETNRFADLADEYYAGEEDE